MKQGVVGLALVVVAGFGLAACGGSAGASAAPAEPPAVAPDRLDGTTWALMTIGDEPLPADVAVTLSFATGTVSGSSGCNTYTGPYTVDGPSLAIGPLATTTMACADAQMAIEAAYLAALGGVTTWAVPQDVPIGTQLTLAGSGAKLVFGPPANGG